MPPVKYLFLIGDGMADWPLDAYGGQTPLEAAHTPHMDRVVTLGLTGQFCPIPNGLPAGSDVGNLSCFGYNPRETFGGRAPIEAAQQGIPLSKTQVVFRCNLVTLADGLMLDFTAGHITTEEAADLITPLNAALRDTFPVMFHPGVGYRHLAVLDVADTDLLDALVDLACTPPHDITGKAWAAHLPAGPGAEMIITLIRRSQEILPGLPVNRRRAAAGHAPATSIWLWGQGKAPSIEPYASKFGLTGAVVSAVDLVKGIGVCAGLDVLDIPGATGWIDTDYDAKVSAALAALDTHDLAYVHVEAPDEAAHQGRADLKIQAIEAFDQRVVAPCLAYHEAHPDSRILVAPDHFTPIATKTHAGGPVPFALCGAGLIPDRFTSFSESQAARSGVLIEDGYALIEQILCSNEIHLTGPTGTASRAT